MTILKSDNPVQSNSELVKAYKNDQECINQTKCKIVLVIGNTIYVDNVFFKLYCISENRQVKLGAIKTAM